MRSKKPIIITCAIFAALIALLIWVIWANTALEINTYTIKSEKLPPEFSGFRIAHLSDLHNAEMGEDNERLIELLKKEKPDIIAITGDIMDTDGEHDGAYSLIEGAVKIAPCYYVTGNHEAGISQSSYSALEEYMKEQGVTVLHSEEVLIERGSSYISVAGLEDPAYSMKYEGLNVSDLNADHIKKVVNEEMFSVLLSHRPELFEKYVAAECDLVLTGHAHGGQFRLPFIGGVIAPGQGLFPEYDCGVYTEGGTSMVVSRGIGNSIIPLRFNNRPEIVMVELECAD
ncbi:MAG: metallophosphoesterase [Clostridia bacterium]|nr:metallophosphoesterase [Clostridia bacterium]